MKRADSQLSFVPYTREFLVRSWEWLTDPETKSLTLTPDFTREQQEAFFASLPARTDYLIWGIMLAGEPIGACGLKHVTEKDAEYWGYIGVKQYWGLGLGVQIVGHCEKMARANGLQAIYLHVGVDNTRARRLYGKCGFVEDAPVVGSEIRMRKIL